MESGKDPQVADRIVQVLRRSSFHQVGVEMFGIKEPTADAEVILMAVNYLKSLGLNDLDVEINSLGCPKCREEFKKRLKEVLKPEFNNLCDDCKTRYEKNPLRLLDCKVESCNGTSPTNSHDCRKVLNIQKPRIRELRTRKERWCLNQKQRS